LADLELTRKALANLFELDRSAARGNMTVRGLPIFKHDCKLGNAPAQSLFDSVIRGKREGVDAPRSFADYQITLPNQADLPKGITLIDGLREEIR
jgi:CRISPR-associated protein Csd2